MTAIAGSCSSNPRQMHRSGRRLECHRFVDTGWNASAGWLVTRRAIARYAPRFRRSSKRVANPVPDRLVDGELQNCCFDAARRKRSHQSTCRRQCFTKRFDQIPHATHVRRQWSEIPRRSKTRAAVGDKPGTKQHICSKRFQNMLPRPYGAPDCAPQLNGPASAPGPCPGRSRLPDQSPPPTTLPARTEARRTCCLPSSEKNDCL